MGGGDPPSTRTWDSLGLQNKLRTKPTDRSPVLVKVKVLVKGLNERFSEGFLRGSGRLFEDVLEGFSLGVHRIFRRQKRRAVLRLFEHHVLILFITSVSEILSCLASALILCG